MGTVKAPYRNTSDMRNQGIELTLGWRDNIGDFSYSVNVNASYNHNKVVKYKGKLIENWVDDNGTKKYSSNIGQVADFNGNGIRVEGSAFDEYFLRQLYKGSGKYYDTNGAVDPNGGPKDGMIRTPEDLQWFRDMRTAGYSFNGVADNKQSGYWYGEYIMADVNGDGNYGNSYDRVMTKKSSTPKYTYGINLSAAWKGIDFNMTWSGAAGMHYYVYSRGLNTSVLSSNEVLPADARKLFYFYNEADPTDARNNINAAYPRLKAKNSSVYIANDRYLYNASYIKLKNVQIGYTLPKKWMDKVFINSLRVFVSGENLWTITDYPGVDPEIGSSLNVYPISRIFSAGVNISF